MAKLDLKEIERRLKKEEKKLETELKKMPEVPELGSDVEGEVFEEEADEAEEYSTNLGIKDAFKQRLADIRSALEKISAKAGSAPGGKNVYGKCEKCQKQISEDVIKASPESRYCKTCKQ